MNVATYSIEHTTYDDMISSMDLTSLEPFIAELSFASNGYNSTSRAYLSC